MSYIPKKSSKKSFTQDIALLLYAHGDVEAPDQHTVAVLEDILVNYLTDVSQELMSIATRNSSSYKKSLKKIKVEDLCFILRRDTLKLSRAKELIVQLRVIKNARSQDLNVEDKKLVEKLVGEGKKRKLDLEMSGAKKKRKLDSSDDEDDEEEDYDNNNDDEDD